MKDRVLVVQRRVAGPRDRVFHRFTSQVDQWWRRGPRFRTWTDSTLVFTEAHLLEQRSADVAVRATILHGNAPSDFALELDGARVEVSFSDDGDHTTITIRHHRPRDGRTAFQDPIGVWWAEVLAGWDMVPRAACPSFGSALPPR